MYYIKWVSTSKTYSRKQRRVEGADEVYLGRFEQKIKF